jgi:hypothetical protein
LAPNVTIHFWDANDINGTPILEITDEDTYFKGLTLTPDLYSLGGWQLTLARAWGFALFGSGAVQPEVFVRFLVHSYSDTTYYYGGLLEKRNLIVVDRDEIGAEQLVIGGPGPKAYMGRSALGIVSRSGLGFNLDLDNGIWRWNEAATAGRVLDQVVDEDNARTNPAMPDATYAFSDTHDSHGDVWTNEVTAGPGEYETPIGSSLLDVIWDLEDLVDNLYTTVHLGEVGAPEYQLNAFQSFGEDRTGSNPGAGVCILREGLNIANDSLEVEGVAIRKATHVIIEGKDGAWATEVRPSWSPGDYVKWDKIEYSRSSSVNILEQAGLRWLRRQDNGDQQITVEILPGDDDDAGYYFPAANRVMWLGDTITLDTVADGSVHSPLDYNNSPMLLTGWEMALGVAGDNETDDKAAKSWTIKVRLNWERAGFSQSPNQRSASSGNNPCQCPPLCHIHIPGDPASEIVTTEKEFNANGDGGDTLDWVGILANQAGGAAGSSNYYFKSTSPDAWSDVYATSAGTSYRVTGYVKDMAVSTSDVFRWGFFESPAAVGSPGTDGTLAQPETVLWNTNASGWTAFAIDTGPAPSGTIGWALGRTGGGISFDQITVATVVSDPGTGGQEGDIPADIGLEGASGTATRAARCDHVHAHGLLSAGETHHHDPSQLEGIGPPDDGDVLTWDDTGGEWVAAAPTGGGGGGTGVAAEYDYAQITSPASPTATTEATANTVITGAAVTYDGATPVLVEFFSPFITPPSGALHNVTIVLYDGSSSVGQMGIVTANPTNASRFPTKLAYRLTPSAASHTYSIRAYVDSGTGTIHAGTAGSGNYVPAYMRITSASVGAWTTYTPTWTASTTNPTLGSTTITGRYKLLDAKTVVVQISISITTGGAWNAGSGAYRFSLPSGMTAAAGRIQVGSAHVLDSGTAHFSGTSKVSASSTTIDEVVIADATGNRLLAHNVPVTWATGDQINLNILLELT